MTGGAAGSATDRATLGAFAGVIILGALNPIAVHETIRELDPSWSSAVRFLLAGLVLAGIVLLTRRAFPRGRSLTGAALYGTVGFAGFLGFMGLALREVPVGTVSVFFALTPLITFGLAIVQRQERFHLQGIAGGLIALAGVAVIFADQLTANVPLSGLLLAVAGIVCLAESAVIVHWIPRSDPFATNAAAMLTGGSLLLIASLLTSERHAVPVQAATVAGLVYLVLLGSVVLFTLFVFTLERWPASTVSYASLVSPIVTVAIVTVLGGERISPAFLLGGAVILAGVYVGAFLHGRPNRTSATSSPECFPIDACAVPVTSRRVAMEDAAS